MNGEACLGSLSWIHYIDGGQVGSGYNLRYERIIGYLYTNTKGVFNKTQKLRATYYQSWINKSEKIWYHFNFKYWI